MAKYSQEFKLKVVEHYLSGHGDSVTGQLFNVHRSDVQKWSKAFKLYGLVGLERRRSKTTFTVEFKYQVVKVIHEEGISLREAMQRFDINETSTLRDWLKQYKENGIEGLQPKPRGKLNSMPKPKMPKAKTIKADQDKTHEELLEELAYLRAEVAFLKKRRALIRKQKEQEKVEQQQLQDSYLN